MVLQGWHPFDDWVQFTNKTCLNSLPVSVKTTHFGHVKSDNLTGCRHQGHPTHHVTGVACPTGWYDAVLPKCLCRWPGFVWKGPGIGVFFLEGKRLEVHSWQWRWNPHFQVSEMMLLQTCDFQVPFYFLGGVTSGRYERQGSRRQGIAAIGWGCLCRWQVVGGG